MTGIGKAFLGWSMICIVIVFSGKVLGGLGTYFSGIGVFLILSAAVEWMENMKP